jgi:hypothetical protein
LSDTENSASYDKTPTITKKISYSVSPEVRADIKDSLLSTLRNDSDLLKEVVKDYLHENPHILKDILNELKSEADSEEINLRMVDRDLAKREIVELIMSKPDCLTSDIIMQLKLDRVYNAGMECH